MAQWLKAELNTYFIFCRVDSNFFSLGLAFSCSSWFSLPSLLVFFVIMSLLFFCHNFTSEFIFNWLLSFSLYVPGVKSWMFDHEDAGIELK